MHNSEKKLKVIRDNRSSMFFVHCEGYRVASEFRNLVQLGELVFKEQKDNPSLGYRRPKPYSDLKSTSTYEKCIAVGLAIDGTSHVEVWDGDLMRGNPVDLRATYYFTGNWWLHNGLRTAVDRNFNALILHMLKKEDEEVLKLRAQILANRILSTTKE